MKRNWYFLFLLLTSISGICQTVDRPKIGLTLSGGGAKGLAHIGILRALDSAGLKVDYISGTSMGAVVGSLYAVGYSGDSIYQLATKMNWNDLLLRRSPMNAFIMEEKSEYGRYAVELPIQKGKIRFPSGILEAEELWMKFDELYAPVYQVRDFDSLPIPFRCIAADVSSGEAVVLDKGSLLSAVRASMAIPTVFTEVEYNDSVALIDGGIIRNFPVRDVKSMGADIIIGSTVERQGRLKASEITSPMQILVNVAFFREHEYSKKDIDLCTYLIRQPLSKYSTASFASSDSIIAIGIETGKAYFPLFKKLADSLNTIYGKPLERPMMPGPQMITLRHIITDSLQYMNEGYLLRMLGLTEGKTYAAHDLQAAIRQAFGTRYFNRLYYNLEPVSPGVADLRLIHKENLPVSLKLALSYTPLTKIMLIVNTTSRDLIGKQSVSGISIGISENPRLRFNWFKVMGTTNFPLSAVAEVYGESQKYPQYRAFKAIGEYRQISGFADARLQLAFQRRIMSGIGIRAHMVSILPISETLLNFKGRNNFFQPYLRFEFNSLDRAYLPRQGLYVLFESAIILGQKQKNSFAIAGLPIGGIDTLNIDQRNFLRGRAQIQYTVKLRPRLVLTSQAEAGANFNTTQYLFHDFMIGGLQPLFRNQVPFTGIPDASLPTNSFFKANLNLRYNFSQNLYAAANTNLVYHSFLKQVIQPPGKFISGYGLTLGLNTVFGPFEINLGYSNQVKMFNNYINAGFRFSRDIF